MFAEWMIFGSVAFWMLLAVASLFLVWIVEEESGGPGVLVVGLFLIAWLCFGDLGQVVRFNPWTVAVLAVGYVAIGIVWCWPKWLFMLNRLRMEYKLELADFTGRRKSDTITKELREEWASIVCSKWTYEYGMSFSLDTGKLTPPSFAHNRSRLIVWAAYWPWSMFWTLLRDPIKWAIDVCGDLFQKTSEWMFRGF